VPTNHQHCGFQRKLRKPKSKPAIHSLWQRRPHNLPLYSIYTATCSESKHKSTAVQCASVFCRAYLGNLTYHKNQHSHPPWPSDDVCKESNGQSLGSVFEYLKPVDKSEVLMIPMQPYNVVLASPWEETQKSTAATVD